MNLSTGYFKFCRHHHILLHRCSHHSMIRSTSSIVGGLAWLQLLIRYFFTDNCTWRYLFSLSSHLSHKRFWTYFAVTNLWVSLSLRLFRFLGKLFSRVSSKFLHDPMSSIYCKKGYSNVEINVFEVNQIRVQNWKKMWLWQVFIVWLLKFVKKVAFYSVIIRG